MKTAEHLTTASIEDERLDLQHEKATLIDLILTLKAFFSKRTLSITKSKASNISLIAMNVVTSGVFIKSFAAVMSILWMLIIITTLFLG